MNKVRSVVIAIMITFAVVICCSPITAGASSDTMISSLLSGWQITFAETRDDMAANGGENFVLGDGSGSKEPGAEGLVLIAPQNENPMFYLNRRLDDVEGLIDRNQAVHIKFMPSGKDFGLMLFGDNNVGITIGENSEPLVFASFGEYMEPMSGNLRIEPGQWYHVLLAMHTSGALQAAVWKDGEENSIAGAYVSIGSAFGDGVFQDQSWELSVGFQGEATVTVDSYEYYTFSGFVMDYRALDGGESQTGGMQGDGNDYGPFWAINIADNFDILSDMIWQSISPQTVTTGNGDQYLGYGLKQLLDFSGNGSSVATVWFNHDEENNLLVEPTFDAYIVFAKNGEFLGGPYLITINGVSQDPVTDVYP